MMTVYQHPSIPLPRREIEEPDHSYRAALADLLDALDLTRQERDAARRELARQLRRLDRMERELCLARQRVARLAEVVE